MAGKCFPRVHLGDVVFGGGGGGVCRDLTLAVSSFRVSWRPRSWFSSAVKRVSLVDVVECSAVAVELS